MSKFLDEFKSGFKKLLKRNSMSLGEGWYKDKVDSIISEAVTATLININSRVGTGLNVKDEVPIVLRYLENEKSSGVAANLEAHKTNLVNTLNENAKQKEELSDYIKVSGKEDFKEKIRTLVFRVLTAISIAGVVLFTSYLAQRWGIPLPLRMGALPAINNP